MSKVYWREMGWTLQEVVDRFGMSCRQLIDVKICGVCGKTERELVCERDRYGFLVKFYLCLNCGVVYLGTRLSHEDYKEFYNGYYHDLISAFWHQAYGPRRYRREQRKYAAALLPYLTPHLHGQELSILDIGGSIGLLSHLLAEELRSRHIVVSVTILDPSIDELRTAHKEYGHRIIKGLVEEHNFRHKTWDLVLLCRSIDHLVDVKGTLAKIHKLVHRDGLLFCDYVTLEKTLVKRGIPGAFQIDHLFNFTEDMFLPMMRQMGFQPCGEQFVNAIERGYIFRKHPRTKGQEFSGDHVIWMQERVEKWKRVQNEHENSEHIA